MRMDPTTMVVARARITLRMLTMFRVRVLGLHKDTVSILRIENDNQTPNYLRMRPPKR